MRTAYQQNEWFPLKGIPIFLFSPIFLTLLNVTIVFAGNQSLTVEGSSDSLKNDLDQDIREAVLAAKKQVLRQADVYYDSTYLNEKMSLLDQEKKTNSLFVGFVLPAYDVKHLGYEEGKNNFKVKFTSKIVTEFDQDLPAAKAMIELADSLIKRHRYIAAIDVYKKTLARYPESREVPEAVDKLIQCGIIANFTRFTPYIFNKYKNHLKGHPNFLKWESEIKQMLSQEAKTLTDQQERIKTDIQKELEKRRKRREYLKQLNQNSPPGMAAIRSGKKIFYMDIYEYPNQADSLPLINKSWIEAQKLCYLQKKRLCYAEEWVQACVGLDSTLYPYGNHYDDKKCNAAGTQASQIAPAGIFFNCQSSFGIYDLSGNAWEWVTDWSNFEKKRRLLKGGGASAGEIASRCSHLGSSAPHQTTPTIGFRCCQDGLVK